MDKKRVLSLSLEAVFLVVFNFLFFVYSGFEHPKSVWIAYAFMHFSYVMVLLTPKLIRRGSSSSVFGFSLYTISAIYFVTEFIVAIIVFITKPQAYGGLLIVQGILLGVYAIFLLSHLLANEHTAEQQATHENEVLFVKNAAVRVGQLVGNADDKKIDREIESVYDLLHSIPARSNKSVQQVEMDILSEVDVLENAVYSHDKDKIHRALSNIREKVNERNATLRVNQI